MTKQIKKHAGALLLILGIFLPTLLIDRTQSVMLVFFFTLSVTGFFMLLRTDDNRYVWGVGLLVRVLLFGAMPILSDDIYRFLWDGFLLKSGIHPFAQLPEYYLESGIPGLSEELYQLLNSKGRFTVYPPINQGIFWLAVVVSDHWLVATGVIRLFLLAADIVTVIYLRKWLTLKGWNPNIAWLYWLNPLIIWEGVGNTHFEGLVFMFLMMGLYYLEQRPVKSAISIGLAAGTKLLPLILYPYFFIRDTQQRKWRFTSVAGMVVLLALLPLASAPFFTGMQASLGLYFQNFEFNSSIFQLTLKSVKWLTGKYQIGVIGPVLSVISFISIVYVSILAVRKKWPVAKVGLVVWTIYLLLTSTVHPWYIIPLVGFGLMAGYLYPLVWSVVIFLSYIGYATPKYDLWVGWLILEYLMVVLAFVYNQRIKAWLTIS